VWPLVYSFACFIACTICFPLGMKLAVDSPVGCSKSVEFIVTGCQMVSERAAWPEWTWGRWTWCCCYDGFGHLTEVNDASGSCLLVVCTWISRWRQAQLWYEAAYRGFLKKEKKMFVVACSYSEGWPCCKLGIIWETFHLWNRITIAYWIRLSAARNLLAVQVLWLHLFHNTCLFCSCRLSV
jgi:hypothetical protein